MKIYSVYDKEFEEYGSVLKEDFKELLCVLSKKECPENATVYEPSDKELESVEVCKKLQIEVFGGLAVQVGYCNGKNDMLNCLEYHKNSEVNVCESDTVLLLGKLQDVKDGKYDTSLVKAFLVPAGCGVELYATSLHYAPCKTDGLFKVAVVLPKGTNYERPEGAASPLLWASNKWLIAHRDSAEAKQGAFVGLIGENLQVK